MAMRRRSSEHGAVFVEFVLVLPFLLGIIFLIINFGVMLSFRQALSQAAAEGARAAAVAPANHTYSDRRTRARDTVNLAFQGQGGAPVSCGTGGLACYVSPDVAPGSPAGPACGEATKCIRVALVYNYEDNPRITVLDFFGPLLPETLSYTASARIN